MQPTTHEIAMNILAELKRRLGEARYAGLGPDDRRLLRACCADAAELQVRALAAARTTDAHLALLRQRADVSGRLCDLSGAAGDDVPDAFWGAAKMVGNGGVAVAFASL